MDTEKVLWGVLSLVGIGALVLVISMIYVGFIDWFLIVVFGVMGLFGLMSAVIIFQNKEQRYKTYNVYEKIMYLGVVIGIIYSIFNVKIDFRVSLEIFFYSVLLFFAAKYGWGLYWANEKVSKNVMQRKKPKETVKAENVFFMIIISMYIIRSIIYFM